MESMQVNIHDAKTRLSQLLTKVEKGEEVIVARAGKPVARIVPFRNKPQRRPGTAKGKLWIADDFDAPLPEEILKDFGL